MNYGLPYLGSKNRIAKQIVDLLPPADHFYDIFAGGCAVTHAALLSGKYRYVHANDLSDVPQLFLDAVNGKYAGETRWIDRETFFALKETDPYIRCVWSFGNKGDTYLYSREVEPYKRACHYVVVLDHWADFDALCPEVAEAARVALRGIADTRERRVEFGRAVVRRLKEIADWSVVEANPLYRSVKRSRRIIMQSLHSLERLQSLESLERLQSLQSLECLESLTITRQDYRTITFHPNSVLYCDPPYAGTDCGSYGGFDHNAFYDWAEKQANPIFISEYQMP